MSVKAKENEDPMNALNRGYLVTTVLAMGGFGANKRAALLIID
jgi:hypothetical protein